MACGLHSPPALLSASCPQRPIGLSNGQLRDGNGPAVVRARQLAKDTDRHLVPRATRQRAAWKGFHARRDGGGDCGGEVCVEGGRGGGASAAVVTA